MSEETITVSVSRYNELVDDQNFLIALRGAGVDNWEGYGDAVESFQEDEDE